MPFKKNDDRWNTTDSPNLPIDPLLMFLAFTTEGDTLVITKKVWNQESKEYDDALVVRFDATMLANLGERLDKIEQMVQKLGASVRKLQRKH